MAPVGVGSESVGHRKSQEEPIPWFSMIVAVICVGMYVAYLLQKQYPFLETLLKYSVLHGQHIWEGAYWGLITSAFVHFELWHLAFNLYWLWILGSQLEITIGTFRYIIFFLSAAFVSSLWQMTVSDNTGIGASGVGYAIFGYMLLARKHDSEFRRVLNKRVIILFAVWFVFCIIATYDGFFIVGNTAHFTGVLFGLAAASSFTFRRNLLLMRILLATFVVATLVLLFWCPWSVTYLKVKAYNVHVSKRYYEAFVLYSEIIRHEPDNSWAYLNRSYVLTALGDKEGAIADLKKAKDLDSSIE